MAHNDERGSVAREWDKPTLWDTGNTIDTPNPFDQLAVLATNAEQRAYAIGVLQRLGNSWDQWLDFVDPDAIQQILDLAEKLMSLNPLAFDNPSDAASATDGKLHVAITPNTGMPGTFDVNTTHPAWITAADLPADTDPDDDTGLVSKNPTSGNPNIVYSPDTTHYGMQVESGASPYYGQADNGGQIIYGVQQGTPTNELVIMERVNVAADKPLLSLYPASGSPVSQINGSGELAARRYSSLPTASANHIGALAVLIGSGTPDTLWFCQLNSDGSTYSWINIGSASGVYFGTPITTTLAAGSSATCTLTGSGTLADPYILHVGIPTGATGATGAQAIFGTPIITELAPTASPTISITGSGTSGDPYILHLGVPQGQTGATGAQGIIDFPPLPIGGSSPVTFTMIIEALGTFLPHKYPAGYVLHVSNVLGYWSGNDSEAIYVTDKAGSPTHNAANGKPFGQLVWLTELVNSDDLQVTLGTLEAYTTDLTIADDNTLVALSENVNTNDPVAGYLLVNITITPTDVWTAFINFGATDGGFVVGQAGSGTHDTNGWESAGFNNGEDVEGVFIKLALDSCTLVSVEFVGSVTIGLYHSPADGTIGVSTQAALQYDTASTMATGAVDYLWNGGSGHAADMSSPQTGVTELYLFLYASTDNSFSGSARVTGITIKGTGPVPSQLAAYLI